jgi:hypothetical protein
MRRPRVWLLTGLAVLLSALTAPSAVAWWPRRSTPVADAPGSPALPVVPRGSTEPVAADLPTTAPDALPVPGAGPRYRALRPAECQCLAAQNSSLANLLDRERYALEDARPLCRDTLLAALFPRHCDVKATRLRLAILFYSAREARNRAAGSALELYLRLAETEAQTDLLNLSHTDLADAIRRSEELAKQGFRVPADLTALRRQLLDVEADRIRARAGLVELNGRLKTSTGLDDLPCDDWLWPILDAVVCYDPIDVEAAVGIALANRAELNLLRTVNQDLDGQTLPVIREYLKSLSGLLGAHVGPAKPAEAVIALLKEFLTGRAAEKALREGQLQQLLAERERAVADEVRRAAANLAIRSRLVALSRERALNAEARRKEAEDKARSGAVSYLEVLNANLDWYKMRSQLVIDVMAWHTAAVQLRQAMGLLVLDCSPSH